MLKKEYVSPAVEAMKIDSMSMVCESPAEGNSISFGDYDSVDEDQRPTKCEDGNISID